MFVHHQLVVPVPVALAEARLTTYLSGDGLQSVSDAAFGDGRRLLLRAGFGGLSKQVEVKSLPPLQRGQTVVIGFSWLATGPVGELFPPLDANLELDPADDGGTTLTLVGSYRPPAGRFGQSLDDRALNRVAQATMRGFLSRLAEVIAAAPKQAADPGPRPVGGTEQPA